MFNVLKVVAYWFMEYSRIMVTKVFSLVNLISDLITNNHHSEFTQYSA